MKKILIFFTILIINTNCNASTKTDLKPKSCEDLSLKIQETYATVAAIRRTELMLTPELLNLRKKMKELSDIYTEYLLNACKKIKNPIFKTAISQDFVFRNQYIGYIGKTVDEDSKVDYFKYLFFSTLRERMSIIMKIFILFFSPQKQDVSSDFYFSSEDKIIFLEVLTSAFNLHTIQATLFIDYLKHLDKGRGLDTMTCEMTKLALYHSIDLHRALLSAETDIFQTKTSKFLLLEVIKANEYIKRGAPNLSNCKIMTISSMIFCSKSENTIEGLAAIRSDINLTMKLGRILKDRYFSAPVIDLQHHYALAIIQEAKAKLPAQIEDLILSLDLKPKLKKKKRKRKRKAFKIVSDETTDEHFEPSTLILKPSIKPKRSMSKDIVIHPMVSPAKISIAPMTHLFRDIDQRRLTREISINLRKLNHIKLKNIWYKLGGDKTKPGNHFLLKANGKYLGWGFVLHGCFDRYSPRAIAQIKSSIEKLASIKGKRVIFV